MRWTLCAFHSSSQLSRSVYMRPSSKAKQCNFANVKSVSEDFNYLLYVACVLCKLILAHAQFVWWPKALYVVE